MTNWERRYFFATCALSVLVVFFFIGLTVSSYSAGRISYCLSDECIKTAAQFIENINSSADPCTDFYEYACGGWKNTGGDEEDDWYVRVKNHLYRLASDLLSKNNSETEFESVKKARSLYRSCMDTGAIELAGLGPLLDLLESVGLPRRFPNGRTAVRFDLSRTLAKIRRSLGTAVFFDVVREDNDTFAVIPKPLDVSYHPPFQAVVKAIQNWEKRDRQARNRRDLSSSTFRDDWQAFVQDNNRLAVEMNAQRLARHSAEVSGFITHYLPSEMDIWRMPASNLTAEIYNGTVPQNPSNTLYYEVYMQTLLEGIPEVNWTTNNGTISLHNPEYHRALLSNMHSYSPLHIQISIWMEVVTRFGVLTTKEFRNLIEGPKAGLRYRPSKSEECAHNVMLLMPLVIEHLFAQVDPKKDVIKEVTAMAEEIRKSLIELVQKAELGSKNILKRLKKLKVVPVGYLDWVTEGRGLDEFYADVKIYDGKLLRTIVGIHAWQMEANFLVSDLFQELINGLRHKLAFYLDPMNTISVGHVLLRFPYLSLGLEAMDYGAIGHILGHEFGHAIDSEAFHKYHYFSLEKPAIAKVDSFINCSKDRTQEISDKLNSFDHPEDSISQYISDIIGTKAALYTFNKIGLGPERRLPGFEDFTKGQLFFLALAQVWCTNKPPSPPNADSGSHKRNRLRILNIASNSPEFAEIWKCPSDSPMNPKNKCTLW